MSRFHGQQAQLRRAVERSTEAGDAAADGYYVKPLLKKLYLVVPVMVLRLAGGPGVIGAPWP
jgi:hypothetical protein